MSDSSYGVSPEALIFDKSKKKVLLCLEDNGNWEFPGGGVENGYSVNDLPC